MARTVKTDKVTTLEDWVARWPKATNLAFDSETREPAIFSADAARTRIGGIPWKREADVMTILSQPSRFTSTAVDAARTRYNEVQEQKRQLATGVQGAIREAEAEIMRLWREHDTTPSITDKEQRRIDIIAKEKELYGLLSDMNADLYAGRKIITTKEYSRTFVPVIPNERRGLSMTAVLGGATA